MSLFFQLSLQAVCATNGVDASSCSCNNFISFVTQGNIQCLLTGTANCTIDANLTSPCICNLQTNYFVQNASGQWCLQADKIALDASLILIPAVTPAVIGSCGAGRVAQSKYCMLKTNRPTELLLLSFAVSWTASSTTRLPTVCPANSLRFVESTTFTQGGSTVVVAGNVVSYAFSAFMMLLTSNISAQLPIFSTDAACNNELQLTAASLPTFSAANLVPLLQVAGSGNLCDQNYEAQITKAIPAGCGTTFADFSATQALIVYESPCLVGMNFSIILPYVAPNIAVTNLPVAPLDPRAQANYVAQLILSNIATVNVSLILDTRATIPSFKQGSQFTFNIGASQYDGVYQMEVSYTSTCGNAKKIVGTVELKRAPWLVINSSWNPDPAVTNGLFQNVLYTYSLSPLNGPSPVSDCASVNAVARTITFSAISTCRVTVGTTSYLITVTQLIQTEIRQTLKPVCSTGGCALNLAELQLQNWVFDGVTIENASFCSRITVNGVAIAPSMCSGLLFLNFSGKNFPNNTQFAIIGTLERLIINMSVPNPPVVTKAIVIPESFYCNMYLDISANISITNFGQFNKQVVRQTYNTYELSVINHIGFQYNESIKLSIAQVIFAVQQPAVYCPECNLVVAYQATHTDLKKLSVANFKIDGLNAVSFNATHVIFLNKNPQSLLAVVFSDVCDAASAYTSQLDIVSTLVNLATITKNTQNYIVVLTTLIPTTCLTASYSFVNTSLVGKTTYDVATNTLVFSDLDYNLILINQGQNYFYQLQSNNVVTCPVFNIVFKTQVVPAITFPSQVCTTNLIDANLMPENFKNFDSCSRNKAINYSENISTGMMDYSVVTCLGTKVVGSVLLTSLIQNRAPTISPTLLQINDSTILYVGMKYTNARSISVNASLVSNSSYNLTFVLSNEYYELAAGSLVFDGYYNIIVSIVDMCETIAVLNVGNKLLQKNLSFRLVSPVWTPTGADVIDGTLYSFSVSPTNAVVSISTPCNFVIAAATIVFSSSAAAKSLCTLQVTSAGQSVAYSLNVSKPAIATTHSTVLNCGSTGCLAELFILTNKVTQVAETLINLLDVADLVAQCSDVEVLLDFVPISDTTTTRTCENASSFKLTFAQAMTQLPTITLRYRAIVTDPLKVVTVQLIENVPVDLIGVAPRLELLSGYVCFYQFRQDELIFTWSSQQFCGDPTIISLNYSTTNADGTISQKYNQVNVTYLTCTGIVKQKVLNFSISNVNFILDAQTVLICPSCTVSVTIKLLNGLQGSILADNITIETTSDNITWTSSGLQQVQGSYQTGGNFTFVQFTTGGASTAKSYRLRVDYWDSCFLQQIVQVSFLQLQTINAFEVFINAIQDTATNVINYVGTSTQLFQCQGNFSINLNMQDQRYFVGQSVINISQAGVFTVNFGQAYLIKSNWSVGDRSYNYENTTVIEPIGTVINPEVVVSTCLLNNKKNRLVFIDNTSANLSNIVGTNSTCSDLPENYPANKINLDTCALANTSILIENQTAFLTIKSCLDYNLTENTTYIQINTTNFSVSPNVSNLGIIESGVVPQINATVSFPNTSNMTVWVVKQNIVIGQLPFMVQFTLSGNVFVLNTSLLKPGDYQIFANYSTICGTKQATPLGQFIFNIPIFLIVFDKNNTWVKEDLVNNKLFSDKDYQYAVQPSGYNLQLNCNNIIQIVTTVIRLPNIQGVTNCTAVVFDPNNKETNVSYLISIIVPTSTFSARNCHIYYSMFEGVPARVETVSLKYLVTMYRQMTMRCFSGADTTTPQFDMTRITVNGQTAGGFLLKNRPTELTIQYYDENQVLYTSIFTNFVIVDVQLPNTFEQYYSMNPLDKAALVRRLEAQTETNESSIMNFIFRDYINCDDGCYNPVSQTPFIKELQTLAQRITNIEINKTLVMYDLSMYGIIQFKQFDHFNSIAADSIQQVSNQISLMLNQTEKIGLIDQLLKEPVRGSVDMQAENYTLQAKSWQEAPQTSTVGSVEVTLTVSNQFGTNIPLCVAEKDWVVVEAINQNQTKVCIGSAGVIANVKFLKISSSASATCHVSQGITQIITVLDSVGAENCTVVTDSVLHCQCTIRANGGEVFYKLQQQVVPDVPATQSSSTWKIVVGVIFGIIGLVLIGLLVFWLVNSGKCSSRRGGMTQLMQKDRILGAAF